ncbi:uncharacterized protein WM277_022724 [Molossus nigricans]
MPFRVPGLAPSGSGAGGHWQPVRPSGNSAAARLAQPLRLPTLRPSQGQAPDHQDFGAGPKNHLQPATGTVPPAHRVNLRTRPPPRSGSTQGLPNPWPSAGSPAYLAGGQGRAAGSGGRAGAGRGPGARCRWWRRRLRLLSLQLPLSPAPPPPPPPAFPRGLLSGQERPYQGSASFGVSQVSSSLRRRQGRGPCPAPARQPPAPPQPYLSAPGETFVANDRMSSSYLLRHI